MCGTCDWRVELQRLDMHVLSDVLGVCDLDVVPLDGAHPHAILGSAFVHGVVLAAGQYDFPALSRFTLPDDWCFIGYANETGAGSWYDGERVSRGMSVATLPGRTVEFRSTAGTTWSAVLMPASRYLRARANVLPAQDDASSPGSTLVETAGSEGGRWLAGYFDSVRQHFIDDGPCPSGDLDELAQTHVESSLMGRVPGVHAYAAHGWRQHYRVLSAAETFLLANFCRHVSSSEIIEHACASERTLRNAFHELLGVSPVQYLSLLRLAHAARCLESADARRTSVKSVVLENGLWDLSRFARDYHALFGELPSQTLGRRRGLRDVAVPVSAALSMSLRPALAFQHQ